MRKNKAAQRSPGTPPASTATSARLLATAAALFREKGYTATSTRELATALGIQNASLYYHIGRKEDLLYTLCIESLRRIYREVDAVAQANSDMPARLRDMIRTHTVVTLVNRDEFTTMMLDLRVLAGDRRQEVLRVRDEFVALIRRSITEAQKSGCLRRDIASKHLALGWFNLVNWSIFWFNPDGSLTPAAIGDLLATLFLEGAGSNQRSAPAPQSASTRGARSSPGKSAAKRDGIGKRACHACRSA